MKRRDLIKGLSLLPLGGTLLGNVIPLQSIAGTSNPAGKGRNLVKELGIRTFINAAGTYTTMSASLMHEEVMDAIDQSAKEFCMLNEV
ncbi:MAG TPA: selenocysteine synthase, partial [Hanamia sp.]|nr:selenocysteine synthase [Hanamia sp.]